MNQSNTESIAIIGMSCKLPKANNLDAFWNLLVEKESGICETPANRWPADKYYAANPQIGKMNTKWGGFLDWFDKFDPNFFGLSEREADSMDPQQRLLLMSAYEALEHAGIPLEKINGTKTGVFVGISNFDFAQIALKNLNNIDNYTGSGYSLSIAANRISYLFNLKGPSFIVDTACSSSLVAINQACESLKRSTSDMALVGGVNLILTPSISVVASQAGAMAPDGQCKTFDKSANGFVRGEGVGMVVLKRESDAIRDNDRILAVIKGSAINHNGQSNGMTAPSKLQQTILIQDALKDAGVQPENISLIEAHGTGTSLGDPIEFNALKSVFSTAEKNTPCFIGSVKSNIGHLEPAAGIAGLIKVVLSIMHKKVPPICNFNELNKHISLQGTPFKIPTKTEEWHAGDQPLMAGVSSFSFGGANAHVILAEPQTKFEKYKPSKALPNYLLTISAKSNQALHALTEKYIDLLESNPEIDLNELSLATQTKRSHFSHRLPIVTSDRLDCIKQLRSFRKLDKVVKPTVQSLKKIAFLFTGQGSQYFGMAKSLYEHQDLFKTYIDRCNEILEPSLACSIQSLFLSDNVDTDKINETQYTQPVLFAIEYALAKLLESFGVKPSYLLGHSLGQLAAACFAEVMSLEDGLRMSVIRGKLIQSTAEEGRMITVFAEKEKVAAIIKAFDGLSIAAINGFKNLVVSGARKHIELLKVRLKAEAIAYKALNVKRAFHSHLMDPILETFEKELSTIKFSQPNVPIILTDGGEVLSDQVTSAKYWCDHLRHTTDFVSALTTLKDKNCKILIEIGPNPILINLYNKAFPDDIRTQCLPSLTKGKDAYTQFTQTIANLYSSGVKLDLTALNQLKRSTFWDLPTYAFDLNAYWLNSYAILQDENAHGEIPIEFEAKKIIKQRHLTQADIQVQVIEILENVLSVSLEGRENVGRLSLEDLGMESILVFILRARFNDHFPEIGDFPLAQLENATIENISSTIFKLSNKGKENERTDSEIEDNSLTIMNEWESDFDLKLPKRIQRKYVHKRVAENVLLARTTEIAEDEFLIEMTQDLNHPFFYEHYLDHVPAMYILEAITQVGRAIPHLHYDMDFETTFVVNETKAQFNIFAELHKPVFILAKFKNLVRNGQALKYADIHCHILQNQKQIGVIKGTGQFFRKADYNKLRTGKILEAVKN